MRRYPALLAGAAVCGALLLASCGGGGDNGSPSPSPTPTSSPTPSPSPSPTPSPTLADYDFTKKFEDTVNNASYVFTYFIPNTGGEVWSDGSLRNGQSSISYEVSPAKVSFVWPDSTTVRTFTNADLQGDTATRRSYRRGDEALLMEVPFEHILKVTYERLDSYIRETVPGMLRSNRVALFFNEVTTSTAIASDLSYTGTAEVYGGKSGTTQPDVYSSPETTFTVTASDKKITGTIRVVERVGSTSTVVAVLPINATVSAANAFSGDFNDTANGFKGKYAGSLAGPAREEMFVIFNVAHTDGRELIGSVIAG